MVHPNLMKVGRTTVVYYMLASKQFSRPLLTVTNLPSQNGASGRDTRSVGHSGEQPALKIMFTQHFHL